MRIGLIAITTDCLAQILHAPESRQYDLAGTPLDTLQSALLLPEGYIVRGISFDIWRRCYGVFVESDVFPEVPEGQLAPEVTVTHYRNADGTVGIHSISVNVPEDHSPRHPLRLPK